MPITKSAKKALRQNKRRRKQNLKRKDAFRKTRKEFMAEMTPQKLAAMYKVIDKAAKTHVFAKKKAARLKSRLAKKFSKQK
jgi:ribosomal protein S20